MIGRETGGRFIFHCSMALALTAAAAGCSGEKPVPVEGVVLLNGEPLGGAAVIFMPVEPASKKGAGSRQANGMTDREGRFHLETVNAKGAFAGQYKVILTKSAKRSDFKPTGDPEKDEQLRARRTQIVPVRYTSFEKTNLVVDVPPGGNRDVRLELTK